MRSLPRAHRGVAPTLTLFLVTVLVGCNAAGDAAAPSEDRASSSSTPGPIDTADRVAFGRWGANEERNGIPLMWTANADGSDPRPVGDQRGWYMEWSPDRTHLIFDFADDNGNEQIATINPDGTDFAQLTTGAGFYADAAYSPDGGTIVFSHSPVPESDASFRQELWIMDADGSNRRQLLAGADGADWEPLFSPDGSRIVFTRDETDDGLTSAIHVINADGTGLRAITPFLHYTEHPRWSPDGETIIYNIEAKGDLDNPDNGIWTVPSTGGEPSQLLPTDDRLHVFKPDYSPDGSKILFGCARRDDNNNEDLCTMNADGTDTAVIVETPEYENHGIWG